MLLRRLKSSYVQGLYTQLKQEESFFDRTKKFSDFCKSMSSLEKFYADQERELFLQSQQLKRFALAGLEPIRDILSYYSKKRNGYSSILILDTLEHLGGVIKSSKIKPYTDLNPLELQTSWEFQLVIHDLKLGLEGKEHMPPIFIGRALSALANIGYKDVQIVQMAGNRLKAFIEDPAEPAANQVYKNHVYSGFQRSEEFQTHLNTLLEWKKGRKKVGPNEHQLLQMIQDFTEQIHNAKLAQKDLASALANVNEQYYMLVAAQQADPLLAENDYVTLGLNKAQELLVEAGILNPYDMDEASNFENLDKLMERAERTFTNLTTLYFPEINNQMVDELYEASKSHSDVRLPELNSNVPNPNLVNANVLGTFLTGLGNIMHVELGDVNEDQGYPNVPWQRAARPAQHLLDPKRQLYIELPYTSTWIEAQRIAEELIPNIRQAAKNADLVSACKLAHGLGMVHIFDHQTFDSLGKVINNQITKEIDLNTLAEGFIGFGLCNSHKNTGKVLFEKLARHPDVELLGFHHLVRTMWAACVLDLQTRPEFNTFFDLLNDSEPAELSREDGEYFREVMVCLEHEVKISDIKLSTHLATSKALYSNLWLHEKNLYHPIKPFIQKIGRYLMSMTMSEEEALKIQKKLRDAENFSLFKFDDVIAMNGFYTYLFFAGSEGVYKGHVLGPYAIKCKLLKAMGKRGLPIPLHEILEIDPLAPSVGPKSLEIMTKYVEKFVGIPENHLQPIQDFFTEFVKIMAEENEKLSNNHLALLLMEELSGAFKLQDMARTKTGDFLYNQGLEEVKLQLLKTFYRFQLLDSESQARIDQICRETSQDKSFLELVKSINEGIKLRKVPGQDFWHGFRQFMHLPNVAGTGEADLTDEIINQKFLLIPEYFHYKDWGKELHSNYPLPTDMSLYDDGLFNNFFFNHRRQQIGLKPDPSETFNSLKIKVLDGSRVKAFLSNLKYEIKRNWSDSEIIDKILNLDVLDLLIQTHLKPIEEGSKVLSRDPEAFAEFMNHQMKSTEDSDQYAKFYRQIYAEDASRQEILHKMKKNLKAVSSKEEFDLHEKTYLRREITERYLKTKEALDLEDPERGYYFHPIFRQSFGRTSDPRDLRKRVYSILDDPDFMEHPTDQEYLSYKKRKAETNLIKNRILLKLHNNVQLTDAESQYLAAYQEALKTASLSQAGKVMIPPSTTGLSIKAITPQDWKVFENLDKADYSKIQEKLSKYSLNDFLFELSHFVDDYLVNRLEFSIIEQRILKEWGVEPDPQGKSKLKPLWNNKGLWWQGSALEEYHWRKTSQFSEKDLQDFFTLYGYDSNKSFIDSTYWKLDLESFNEMMNDAKGSDFQLDFIREWWQRKVMERKTRFTVPDGKFAKSDKKVFRTWYNEIAEENKDNFFSYFGINFESITDTSFDLLFQKVKQLVYDPKTNQALNLLRMVYFHPLIPERIQEDLYGIVQSLKLPIYENLTTALDPIKVRGDRLSVEVSDEEWAKRIENASVNFIPELIRKIMTK